MTALPTSHNPRLQALIDEVRSSSQRRTQAALSENHDYIDISRKMDSVDEFLDVGQRAIDSLLLDSSALADARARGCRTEAATWRPHAAGYIGAVANGDWYRIVRTAILGASGDLSIRQYNGDWKLAGARLTTFFEDTIEKRTANAADRAVDKTFRQVVKRQTTRFFLLVMEFVDIRNQPAATYNPDDGMPADDLASQAAPVHLRSLLELARHADIIPTAAPPTPEPSDDSELQALKQQNTQLADELGELRAMMTEFIQQQQQQQAAPKKRRRRTSAKAAVDDGIDAGIAALASQSRQGQDS